MDRLDELHDKVVDGTITHEEVAELWASTATGAATGVPAEQLLVLLRWKYPDITVLRRKMRAWMDSYYAPRH